MTINESRGSKEAGKIGKLALEGDFKIPQNCCPNLKFGNNEELGTSLFSGNHLLPSLKQSCCTESVGHFGRAERELLPLFGIGQ